jgi:uncharacterized protein YndB with AHSA1/START domain
MRTKEQSMAPLFVDEAIDINADAMTVWKVLTSPGTTAQWVNTGWAQHLDGPAGPIASDWRPGSPVEWRNHDGQPYVTGNVTAVEPGRLLRFTVFPVEGERPPADETDGITFTLTERMGRTHLAVRQGDFAKVPDGENYHWMSVEVWARVLPKIKELAEKAGAAAYAAG